MYLPPTSPFVLLPLRLLQLSQSPCRPSLYGLSKVTAYFIDSLFKPIDITFVKFLCRSFQVFKFYYIWQSFGLSTMLGLNCKGTCFICQVLIRSGRGSLRFNVKKGLLGLFSCSRVKVLSSEVTGGKRSTDLPVSLATQQVILILRSSSIKFCSSVKSYLQQKSAQISCTRSQKNCISYCTQSGSLILTFSIITFAVEPFSIINISVSYFLFTSLHSYFISLSVKICCISRPPSRWVYSSQCCLHFGQSSVQSWRISGYFRIFRIFLWWICFSFWQASRAIGLQFGQKHCSMLCQFTIGPYRASTSIRQFMHACQRFGGCRNCFIDFRVILYGSSEKSGGF